LQLKIDELQGNFDGLQKENEDIRNSYGQLKKKMLEQEDEMREMAKDILETQAKTKCLEESKSRLKSELD
jgi:chromosome segregation ATPase